MRDAIVSVSAIAVAGLLVSFAVSADAEDLAAVKAAGQVYETAVKSLDAKALRELLEDDFVVIGADGSRTSKSQMVASALGGNFRFESIKTEDVRIRLYGDTAIETGRVKTSGRNGNRPFTEDLLYTDVWIKRNGRWLLAGEHDSYYPKR